MSALSARAKTVSSVSVTITLSARKLSIELKEKQREALLKFCLGRDVFVSLPTGYGKSISLAFCRWSSISLMVSLYFRFHACLQVIVLLSR